MSLITVNPQQQTDLICTLSGRELHFERDTAYFLDIDESMYVSFAYEELTDGVIDISQFYLVLKKSRNNNAYRITKDKRGYFSVFVGDYFFRLNMFYFRASSPDFFLLRSPSLDNELGGEVYRLIICNSCPFDNSIEKTVEDNRKIFNNIYGDHICYNSSFRQAILLSLSPSSMITLEESVIPIITISDVKAYRFIIRKKDPNVEYSEFYNEPGEIIAQYNTLNQMLYDGWFVDKSCLKNALFSYE